MTRSILFISLLFATSPAAWAKTLVSNDLPKTVIELYTSQGCSSCPPADRWLNQYTENDAALNTVLPLAFHVDYWDYLGWKDPFANADYSNRQRDIARAGRSGSVYTPQFVINGNEWRGWFRGRSLPRPYPAQGILSAELNYPKVTAHYRGGPAQATGHIVLLGFGAETPIARGENRNKTLPHDYVVLWHQSTHITDAPWAVTIPSVSTIDFKRFAIGVWVTDTDTNSPLQLVGDWVDLK